MNMNKLYKPAYEYSWAVGRLDGKKKFGETEKLISYAQNKTHFRCIL